MTTVPGYDKMINHAGKVELADAVDLGDVALGKFFYNGRNNHIMRR